MTFADDTAVRPAADVFEAEIRPGWDVAGNANGGYLLALGARAMAAATRPHPVSLTAHYVAPGRPGPVTVRPEVVREGRRFTTVRASLATTERRLVEYLGSFADEPVTEGPERIDSEPPDLPPPDRCVRLVANPEGFPPPLMDRIDLRLHPDDAGFGLGEPSGWPLFRGWFRLLDEPVDAFGLLLALDSFPPTVFNAALPIAWTPTVELTAHLRHVPVPGWLRCRFSTRFVTGGLLEEDGELWDDAGRLVAQSRQLALVPQG